MNLQSFRSCVVATSALLSCLILSGCSILPGKISAANAIPIQHEGRVQTFQGFASSIVRLVTNKSHWEKKEPTRVLLEGLSERTLLGQKEWIRIDYLELVQTLGLDKNKRYYSYRDIDAHRVKLENLVRSAQEKRDGDVRPSQLEQKSQTLYSKFITVESLISGNAIRVIPAESPAAWMSPFEETRADPALDFQKILTQVKDGFELLDHTAAEWNRKVHQSTRLEFKRSLDLELIYLNLHPFRTAFWLYLASFLFFVMSPINRFLHRIAWILGLAAFGFHTGGLVLRVLILSRPPVSNMFESIVFMNWALIIFAMVFTVTARHRLPFVAGSLVSAFIMLYADLLPIDAGLGTLVPVLRSNYWLTIHVMTIVSSYGAFGLAMALGHRHLYMHLRGLWILDFEEASEKLINRVLQIGVLLLGIGTVLGGVWANESWGRFWGWDPKETWALITFLGYLILIHLRHFKAIAGFGLAVGSIIGFLLVLMTWYGVNFVLGRGLHSYGQGSGGMNWVGIYVVLEALFLTLCFLKKPSRRQ